MRLTDCHPVWTGVHGSPRERLGLNFDCPLCVRAGRLSVHGDVPQGSVKGAWAFAAVLILAFKNPRDGLPPEPNTNARWTRDGDDFEVLTLSPSVNAEDDDHAGHKGWHGFLVAGELRGGGL